MKISAAASALKAQYFGNDGEFQAISIDSRTISAGELFFAISGPNFDGHDFIIDAMSKQAVASVILTEKWDWIRKHIPEVEKHTFILVADVHKALGQLAKVWKEQYDIMSVVITGSCGKTTVKNMLAAIIQQIAQVHATKGNQNNDIGVPLSLFGLNAKHQFGVFELGANYPGEILYTSCLVNADIAVILNAGDAHLHGFGSVAGVAEAKSEIFQGVKSGGVAVINLDSQFSELWRDKAAHLKQITVSCEQLAADYQLLNFSNGVNDQQTITGSSMIIKTPDNNEVAITLPLLGAHNAFNALISFTIADQLGIPINTIKEGLGQFHGTQQRLELVPCRYPNILLIDDTYNANPTSVAAAIDVLASYQQHKILVLGEMAELGDYAESKHQQMGLYAKQKGINQLIALGPFAELVITAFGKGGIQYNEKAEILEFIEQSVKVPTVILFKGSRISRIDEIVTKLKLRDN